MSFSNLAFLFSSNSRERLNCVLSWDSSELEAVEFSPPDDSYISIVVMISLLIFAIYSRFCTLFLSSSFSSPKNLS